MASTRIVERLVRGLLGSASRTDLTKFAGLLSAATGTPLDHLYSRLGSINGLFFPGGWGNLSIVQYEEDLQHLLGPEGLRMKIYWRKVEQGKREGLEYGLYEGSFRTPCIERVHNALPPESRVGRVQLLLPARLQPFVPTGASSQWAGRSPGMDAPACVLHLAATGDQTFSRRLQLAFPLLAQGICSMVLESPYYGARKPEGQRGSKLQRVSDLLLLGYATINESLHLLHWLRGEGFGPLGMCGLSMGGVHACMTSGLYQGPVATTPLLAPRSAAVAYCDGAMKAAMSWQPLLKDVDENNMDIHQVLMEAGRAQSVMREATYALAELDLRAQESSAGVPVRHAAAGAPTSVVSSHNPIAQQAADNSTVVNGAASSSSDVGSSGRISSMDFYDVLARAAGQAGAQQQQPGPGACSAASTHVGGDGGSTLSSRESATDTDTNSTGASLKLHEGAAGRWHGGQSHAVVRDLDSHPRPHPLHSNHGHSHGATAHLQQHQQPADQRPHPPPHGHMPRAQQQQPHGAAAQAAAGAGPAALGRRLLGGLGLAVRQLREQDRGMARPETVLKLKRVLETYTDITRYPRPQRPDAAVIVAARDDAYVSRESVRQLHQYWAGSELRTVPGGHISAFLFQKAHFRQAIRDSLARMASAPQHPNQQR